VVVVIDGVSCVLVNKKPPCKYLILMVANWWFSIGCETVFLLIIQLIFNENYV